LPAPTAFIEELTKAVVESGVLTDAGARYTAAGPLPALAIPNSLNASLLARLDRLAPVREVAQIGAAVGRQFSHALISAVALMPQPQLDDALMQLLLAEFDFSARDSARSGIHLQARTGAGCRARHLAARPAATTAWAYRRHPGTAISRDRGDAARATGAALCGSGFIEKAVGYCLKAGQQAIARGTMIEALAQLRKGLDILAGT
jgi:hypothetical protein